MARYVMLVGANPSEGQDAEFNAWYDQVHLGEVLAVPGFLRAERFRTVGANAHRYMTIYEIEAESAEEARANLMKAAPAMAQSPAIARDATVLTFLEPVGPLRSSREEAAVAD